MLKKIIWWSRQSSRSSSTACSSKFDPVGDDDRQNQSLSINIKSTRPMTAEKRRQKSKKQKRATGRGRWNQQNLSQGLNPSVQLRVNFLQQASVLLLMGGGSGAEVHQEGQSSSSSPPQQQQDHQLQLPDHQAQALSRTYARQAKRIAHRSVIRVQKSKAHAICDRCDAVLIPGWTGKPRVRGREVSLACMMCGHPHYEKMRRKPRAAAKHQIVAQDVAEPCDPDIIKAALSKIQCGISSSSKKS